MMPKCLLGIVGIILQFQKVLVWIQLQRMTYSKTNIHKTGHQRTEGKLNTVKVSIEALGPASLSCRVPLLNTKQLRVVILKRKEIFM